MQPILDVKNLNKTYAGGFEALKDVSLEIERGEIFGLLGPNGAGKTTCFYMIVGLIPASEGLITVDEHDVTHEPVNVRSGLGLSYLPQEASIFRKLSVRDNVMAILEMRDDLAGCLPVVLLSCHAPIRCAPE